MSIIISSVAARVLAVGVINFTSIHCVKCVQIRDFSWSVFSRIWTEYEEIRDISPYSVQMRENTDQKKLRIWILFMQCRIHLTLYSGGCFFEKN